MILAAGLGSRLKPLTDKIPKALVEVDGKPMLSRLINRLTETGYDNIVVNVHHFAYKIRDFLVNSKFSSEIKISDESDRLLDTGGSLVKAFDMLFHNDDLPVLVHNVDILSNADLGKLVKYHLNSDYAITLLVNNRDSSRKLIFDRSGILKGWHSLKEDKYLPENIDLKEDYKELAFSGIYVVSKESIKEMKALFGDRKFSVTEYFLHPSRKLRIGASFQQDLILLDIGKPAALSQASDFIKRL